MENWSSKVYQGYLTVNAKVTDIIVGMEQNQLQEVIDGKLCMYVNYPALYVAIV